MKNQNYIIIAIVALLVGAGAFYGGMKYQETKTPTLGNGQFFQRNGGGAGGQFAGRSGQNGQRGGGARPVNGEIISADDKTVTVKMTDGSSKIVILSDSTQINKAATGSKTDLKTGEKVAVFGTDNSDGTVTAQNIQLNPIMRMFGATPSASPK